MAHHSASGREAAAHDLVEPRDRWLNAEDAARAKLKKRTLTNLYNGQPMWLELAHRRLDEAVLDLTRLSIRTKGWFAINRTDCTLITRKLSGAR